MKWLEEKGFILIYILIGAGVIFLAGAQLAMYEQGGDLRVEAEFQRAKYETLSLYTGYEVLIKDGETLVVRR